MERASKGRVSSLTTGLDSVTLEEIVGLPRRPDFRVTNDGGASFAMSELEEAPDSMSLAKPPRTAEAIGSEDEELARFRRDWAEEVKRRKEAPRDEAELEDGAGASLQGKKHDASVAESSEQRRVQVAPLELHRGVAKSSSVIGNHVRPVSKGDLATSRPISAAAPRDTISAMPSVGHDSQQHTEAVGARSTLGASASQDPIRLMRRAVVTYSEAVAAERSGRLDEALQHYRKAFRLDAEVDSLFDRACKGVQAQLEARDTGKNTIPRRDILIEDDNVLQAVCAALDVDDHRYVAIQVLKRRAADAQSLRDSKDPDTLRNNITMAPVQALASETHDNNRQEPVARPANKGGDQLARLLKTFSGAAGGTRDFAHLSFLPEDEEKPMHIATLPDELLLVILSHVASPRGTRGAEIRKATTTAPQSAAVPPQGQRRDQHASSAQSSSLMASADKHSAQPPGIGVVLAGPDYMSVEQLGRVCWKLRLLTRALSVWKLIVNETYYPPQIDPDVELPSLLERHDDWRTTFVDHPRVRLNGAYIAAHHYTRPGVHEDNVWVRVVHVVEFYRSLRFLPDGRLLSLLTTDPPNETVRRMEPSLRIKGFAIGHWRLYADGLDDDDACGRPPGPKVFIDELHDKTLAGYTFRMILKLDKTSRGKWNRMEMLEFESVNLRTGEVCPLPMNHKKPFHFSTVRSYGI